MNPTTGKNKNEEIAELLNGQLTRIMSNQKEFIAKYQGGSIEALVEKTLVDANKWFGEKDKYGEKKIVPFEFITVMVMKNVNSCSNLALSAAQVNREFRDKFSNRKEKFGDKLIQWSRVSPANEVIRSEILSWPDKGQCDLTEKILKNILKSEPQHINFLLEQLTEKGHHLQADFLSILFEQGEQNRNYIMTTPRLEYMRNDLVKNLTDLNLIGMTPVHEVAYWVKSLCMENETFSEKFSEISGVPHNTVIVLGAEDKIYVQKVLIPFYHAVITDYAFPLSDPNPTSDKYNPEKLRDVQFPLSFCYARYYPKEVQLIIDFGFRYNTSERKEDPLAANESFWHLIKTAERKSKKTPSYTTSLLIYAYDNLIAHPDWKLFQRAKKELNVLSQICSAKLLSGLRHLINNKEDKVSPFWNRLLSLYHSFENNANEDVKEKSREILAYIGDISNVSDNNHSLIRKLNYQFNGLKAKNLLLRKLKSLENDLKISIKNKEIDESKILYFLYIIQLCAESGLAFEKKSNHLLSILEKIQSDSVCKKFLNNEEISKFHKEVSLFVSNCQDVEQITPSFSYEELRRAILNGNLDAALDALANPKLFSPNGENIIKHLANDIDSEQKDTSIALVWIENSLAFLLAYFESKHIPSQTAEIEIIKNEIQNLQNVCKAHIDRYVTNEILGINDTLAAMKLITQVTESTYTYLKDRNSLEVQALEEKLKEKTIKDFETRYTELSANPNIVLTSKQAEEHLECIMNVSLFGYRITKSGQKENKLMELLLLLGKNNVFKEDKGVKELLDKVYSHVKNLNPALNRQDSIEDTSYGEFLESILKGNYKAAMMLIHSSQYFSSKVRSFLKQMLLIVKKNSENELYLQNLLFLAKDFLDRGDVPVRKSVREEFVLAPINEILALSGKSKDIKTIELRGLLELSKENCINRHSKNPSSPIFDSNNSNSIDLAIASKLDRKGSQKVANQNPFLKIPTSEVKPYSSLIRTYLKRERFLKILLDKKIAYEAALKEFEIIVRSAFDTEEEYKAKKAEKKSGVDRVLCEIVSEEKLNAFKATLRRDDQEIQEKLKGKKTDYEEALKELDLIKRSENETEEDYSARKADKEWILDKLLKEIILDQKLSALKATLQKEELKIRENLENVPHVQVEDAVWGVHNAFKSFFGEGSFTDLEHMQIEEKIRELNFRRIELEKNKRKKELKAVKNEEKDHREAIEYATAFLEVKNIKVGTAALTILPEYLKTKITKLTSLNLLGYSYEAFLKMLENKEETLHLFTSYFAFFMRDVELREYAGQGEKTDPRSAPNLSCVNARMQTLELFLGYLFLITKADDRGSLKSNLIDIMDLAWKARNIHLARQLCGIIGSNGSLVTVKSQKNAILNEYDNIFNGRDEKYSRQKVVEKAYEKFIEENKPFIYDQYKIFNQIGITASSNPVILENGNVATFGLVKVAELKRKFADSIEYCKQYPISENVYNFIAMMEHFAFIAPKEPTSFSEIFRFMNDNKLMLNEIRKA